MFSACFLIRGPLGYCAKHRSNFMPLIPFMLALAMMLLAVNATSAYLRWMPEEGDVFWRAFLYLSIYPLFTLAVGIVLVTAFTQQVAQNVQNVVSSRLRDQASEVLEVIQNYADFRDLALSNSALSQVGRDLLDPYRDLLDSLSRGQLEVGGEQTPRLLALLVRSYTKRFDAVSFDDLDYWWGDQTAREYLRLNEESVLNGSSLTRIFIFLEKDLNLYYDECVTKDKRCEQRTKIAQVLARHHQAQMGWAFALFEELEQSATSESEIALDFALYTAQTDRAIAGRKPDCQAGVGAITFFREYREARRKFKAVFDTPGDANKRTIQEHIGQYEKVARSCWVANSHFVEQNRLAGCDVFKTHMKNYKTRMQAFVDNVPVRDKHWSHTFAAEADAPFLFVVKEIKDIPNVLQAVADLRKLRKDWFDSTAPGHYVAEQTGSPVAASGGTNPEDTTPVRPTGKALKYAEAPASNGP
jgi:hypothetical protein